MEKQQIHQACIDLLQEKINSLKSSIAQAEESMSENTKSSMGDKYENSREIINQEISKRQEVLHNTLQIREALLSIDVEKICNTVQAGSLITTDKATFYIAGSLGRIIVEGNPVMVISERAPIYQALKRFDSEKTVSFNGMQYDLIQMS